MVDWTPEVARAYLRHAIRRGRMTPGLLATMEGRIRSVAEELPSCWGTGRHARSLFAFEHMLLLGEALLGPS